MGISQQHGFSHLEVVGAVFLQVRVGDVGGNSLGLYGAVFGPSGDCILAHGHQGEFHLWKKVTSGAPYIPTVVYQIIILCIYSAFDKSYCFRDALA